MAKKYVHVVAARPITMEAKRQYQDMKCAGSVPARGSQNAGLGVCIPYWLGVRSSPTARLTLLARDA
jgi:hypothetical protein